MVPTPLLIHNRTSFCLAVKGFLSPRSSLLTLPGCRQSFLGHGELFRKSLLNGIIWQQKGSPISSQQNSKQQVLQQVDHRSQNRILLKLKNKEAFRTV